MYYVWPEQNRDATVDNTSMDKIKDKNYVYDLELDEKGNILGGEWGSRADENGYKVKYSEQPDFIWMAAPQNLPYSEMSMYATPGTKIDITNPRPFGNMKWAWDGKAALPTEWMNAAKADETWQAPDTGESIYLDDGTEDVTPATAKNAVLKSAQPLSHIVYFLFDKARSPDQK